MVEGEDEDDDDDEDYEDDEEISSCAEDRLKQYASLTGSRGGTDD
jgi:hypothetical protein